MVLGGEWVVVGGGGGGGVFSIEAALAQVGMQMKPLPLNQLMYFCGQILTCYVHCWDSTLRAVICVLQ